MELKHIATREGRLSSFLREEMKMSAGLMNRLKWQELLFVNGEPVHTDYPVKIGDTITLYGGEDGGSRIVAGYIGEALCFECAFTFE